MQEPNRQGEAAVLSGGQATQAGAAKRCSGWRGWKSGTRQGPSMCQATGPSLPGSRGRERGLRKHECPLCVDSGEMSVQPNISEKSAISVPNQQKGRLRLREEKSEHRGHPARRHRLGNSTVTDHLRLLPGQKGEAPWKRRIVRWGSCRPWAAGDRGEGWSVMIMNTQWLCPVRLFQR